MYDDVAKSMMNPFKGELFNKPTPKGTPGVDVYKGCNIDYSGKHVNPSNFINILKGNKAGVKGGNGKVLNSTKDDKVFVNFVDHGGVGLIAFPDYWMFSRYLYAEDLIKTLNYMHENNMYKELVFYLEACESGSMFKNLPKDIKIFATTAANASESSWGDYCSPNDKVDGKSIGSCLGDLYSVNWMENSDASDLSKETLLS